MFKWLAILLVVLAGTADARMNARGTNVGPWIGGQVVQQALTTFSGTPGSTFTTNAMTGVTAGNALIVAFDTSMSTDGVSFNCNGQACVTRPITSITGSGGTCVRGTGPTTGYHPIELWVCSNVTSGSHTLVLNLTAPTAGGDYLNPEVRLIEVTAATSALEGTVSASNQNVFGSGSFQAAIATNGNVSYNDFVYSKGMAGPFTSVGNPGIPYSVFQSCGASACEVIVPGASFGPYFIPYNSNFSSLYDAAVIVLKGPTPVASEITGVSVAGPLSFLAGSPDGTPLGPVQVSMIGPPFSGTLALSGTDAAKFRLTSTTLPSTLVLNGTQACGNFSITLTATQPGATFSPKGQALSISSPCGPQVVQNTYTFFATGPQTTATFSLTGVGSGHTILFINPGVCGDVNCTPTTAPTISSMTATGGTCALVPGAQAAGAGVFTSTEIWRCTGVSSGTVSIGVTYSGSAFYAQGAMFEIVNMTAIDTGTGNHATHTGSSAAVTVSTGAAILANDLVIASTTAGGISVPAGFTTSAAGPSVVYQQSTPAGTVTANFGTTAANWGAAIAGFK